MLFFSNYFTQTIGNPKALIIQNPSEILICNQPQTFCVVKPLYTEIEQNLPINSFFSVNASSPYAPWPPQKNVATFQDCPLVSIFF